VFVRGPAVATLTQDGATTNGSGLRGNDSPGTRTGVGLAWPT
jgi:hypothetical protein